MKRPKKKIDTRKSREVISRSATNQKKNGTHKATARRKEENNKIFTTDEGRVPKDRQKFMKMNKYSGKKSDA